MKTTQPDQWIIQSSELRFDTYSVKDKDAPFVTIQPDWPLIGFPKANHDAIVKAINSLLPKGQSLQVDEQVGIPILKAACPKHLPDLSFSFTVDGKKEVFPITSSQLLIDNSKKDQPQCEFGFSLTLGDNVVLGTSFLEAHPVRLTAGKEALLGFSVVPIKKPGLSTTMIVVISFVCVAVVAIIVGVAIWQKKKKSAALKTRDQEKYAPIEETAE